MGGVALLGIVSGLVAACSPVAPTGISCSENSYCPDGQTCGLDLVCRYPGEHPPVEDDETQPVSSCEPQICLGSCGVWSCTQQRCVVSEELCDFDQTCDPVTRECEDNQGCDPGDIDTAVCNECGQKVCQEDGSWGSCEPNDACGADESCEPFSGGFVCEPVQVCSPNTLLDEDGCGDCGDLYCNADGSGTECRKDAGECPSGSCNLVGAEWTCQTAATCEIGLCDPQGPPCCDFDHDCYLIPGNEYECRSEPFGT